MAVSGHLADLTPLISTSSRLILPLTGQEDWDGEEALQARGDRQKLREANVALARGKTVAEACRGIRVTEHTYYCWRREYGGLKVDQVMQRSQRRMSVDRASTE